VVPLKGGLHTYCFYFLILLIVGGGFQTGSTRHRGHLLSYCACPGWLWGWRIIRWNEDWQGKPKYSEKTCPIATLSVTNPTWPDSGSNPGRRGGKPATNRFSYGAATTYWLQRASLTCWSRTTRCSQEWIKIIFVSTHSSGKSVSPWNISTQQAFL
jgi:hypothetical protein